MLSFLQLSNHLFYCCSTMLISHVKHTIVFLSSVFLAQLSVQQNTKKIVSLQRSSLIGKFEGRLTRTGLDNIFPRLRDVSLRNAKFEYFIIPRKMLFDAEEEIGPQTQCYFWNNISHVKV